MKKIIPILIFAVAAAFAQREPELPEEYKAKCREFEEYAKNYKPDYSDSSNYLKPPPEHRFSEPIPLVKDGKPVAEIIYSNEEPARVIPWAAKEFQRHIKMITGAELPIRNQSTPSKRPVTHIYLGLRNWWIDNMWFGENSFHYADQIERLAETDGFAIHAESYPESGTTNIFIFGATPAGTKNGLMAFLENNTDLIWARPCEEIGTIYTKTNTLDIVWGENVFDRPATPARGYSSRHDSKWFSHNRCNIFGSGGGDQAWSFEGLRDLGTYRYIYFTSHNICYYLGGTYNFERHPEWFALVRGKRKLYAQPCISNEEMGREWRKSMIRRMRVAPTDTTALGLSLDDTWECCECEKCTAPIKLQDGTVVEYNDTAFRSTQFFMFVNRAAEELVAANPRARIHMLAYFQTAEPPKCGVHPAIDVAFAPYMRVNDRVAVFFPENYIWLDRIARWSKKTKRLSMYEYFGLGNEYPRPLAETYKFDFKEYYKYVTVGIAAEWEGGDFPDDPNVNQTHLACYDNSAMEYWVMSRLMWDPGLDVEELRKYYLRRTFREAAPAMEKIYGIIREEWYKSPAPSNCGSTFAPCAKRYLIDTGRVGEIRDALDEAHRLVKHPVSAKLVDRFENSFMKKLLQTVAKRNPELVLPLIRPEVEPDFDSPIWDGASPVSQFIKLGKDAAVALNASEAKLFHDLQNVWILVTHYDKNIAKLPLISKDQKMGSYPDGDATEFYFLDPADNANYYMFVVNPANDNDDYKGYDGKWDGKGWKTWTRVRDDSWQIIIKMPLETFNATPGARELKLQIIRQYGLREGAAGEYSSWSGGGHHDTSRFGTIKLMR